MSEPSTDTSARALIEIRNVWGKTTEHALEGERVILGRSEQATIQLPSEAVSRRHAECFCDPFGRWWIRDLNSVNGTRVNGRFVTEMTLGHGDVIEIGEFSLRLRLPGQSSIDSGVQPGPGTGLETITTPRLSVPLGDSDNARISTLFDVPTPKIDMRHLAELNRLADQVGRVDEPQLRFEQLCRLMVREDFHGRAAVALRLDPEDPELPPTLLCPAQGAEDTVGQLPYLSRSLLRVLRESDTPALAAQMSSDPGAVQMTIISGQEDLAAAACPIRRTAAGLDVLYVTLPAKFGTGEWLTLIAHAAQTFGHVESTLEMLRDKEAKAVIEGELERASKIQIGLVPRDPSVDGLEISIGFEPCRWVGGDYVDILSAPDGRTVLACADVCGKGLPAAIISSTVHSMVHACQHAGIGLVEMMRTLNDYLYQYLHESSFVTMAALVIDPATGAYELVNAGHPSPIVIAPDGTLNELQSGENYPLGILPFEITSQTGTLGSNRLLAMFTDGLTELTDENEEQLGPERLAAHLRELYAGGGGASAQSVADALTKLLDRYQGDRLPLDDRTFLLARRI